MRLKRKKPMFIHTNQLLIASFLYKKRYLFFAELAMSQRWSAIVRATGAWGGKPIGRVRVKSGLWVVLFFSKFNHDAVGMYSWMHFSLNKYESWLMMLNNVTIKKSSGCLQNSFLRNGIFVFFIICAYSSYLKVLLNWQLVSLPKSDFMKIVITNFREK